MTLPLSFILLVCATGIALILRRPWLHAVVAVALTPINAFVLLFSFDSSARVVMLLGEGNSTRYTPYEAGVQAMRVSLINYQFFLVASCVSLCLLVLFRPKA